MMSKFFKGLLLVFIVFGAVLLIWESPHPFQVYRSRPLPDFAVTTLEGESHSTKDWNNYRPRAYNIFASWCAPCRRELPQIKALGALIPVYGIAVQDSAANIKKMLAREGNPFTETVLDEKSFTGLTLGVSGLPTTIIIDKYGQIAEVYQGPISPEMLEEKIKPLLEGLHER